MHVWLRLARVTEPNVSSSFQMPPIHNLSHHLMSFDPVLSYYINIHTILSLRHETQVTKPTSLYNLYSIAIL